MLESTKEKKNLKCELCPRNLSVEAKFTKSSLNNFEEKYYI